MSAPAELTDTAPVPPQPPVEDLEDVFPIHLQDIDGHGVQLEFTGDFPPDDYWSRWARAVIAGLGEDDVLLDRPFIEFGSGDDRNGLLALSYGATHYTAVEYGPKRSELGQRNAKALGVDDRVEHVVGDAVAWVQEEDPHRFENAVIFACLPQVPATKETKSRADAIKEELSFGDAGQLDLGGVTAGQAGLTLIAASLRALREKVSSTSNTDVFFVLSDRMPDELKYRLLELTGWEEVIAHRTPHPVPTDIDTGLSGFEATDDGRRFYDTSRPVVRQTERGLVDDYETISAAAAEERRKAALGSAATNGSRPEGYPHHHVTIHHLRPKRR